MMYYNNYILFLGIKQGLKCNIHILILFLNQIIDKVNDLIRRIHSIRRGGAAAQEAVQY